MTKAREDIFVYLINFPETVDENITQNEDGTFSIFVNSKLSYEGQLKAYEHAMNHIERGDFEKTDVQQIECQVRSDKAVQAIPAMKYLEELKKLQEEHKALKRRIERDEKRIQFLIENSDLFARAEAKYLYK